MRFKEVLLESQIRMNRPSAEEIKREGCYSSTIIGRRNRRVRLCSIDLPRR